MNLPDKIHLINGMDGTIWTVNADAPGGVEYIKTTLIAKTGGGAEVPCGGVLSAHAIKEQLDKLLNKVNAVTCPYRHGQKVTDRVLTELSNRQLEVEKALRDMGI